MKKNRIRKTDVRYLKNILYVTLVPLIILGKLVRYTVMKTVLVDTSIGHSFLEQINHGTVIFSFLNDGLRVSTSGNAEWFFHFGKYLGLTTYIEYEIVITILWNLLLLVLFRRVLSKLTFGQIFFSMLSVAVLNIFCFTLSKEPVQMLYFVALYYVILSGRLSITGKYICSVLVIALAVLTYRSYYVLILLFGMSIWGFMRLVLRLSRKDKISFAEMLLGMFFSIAVYFFFLQLCKLLLPDVFAELYRVRSRTSAAASDIRRIFDSDNLILFCLDYWLILSRMLFPVELLPLGVKYLPYALYQIILSCYVIRALRSQKNNTPEQNLALYLYLGFFFASGTFEPDFGSWVRHEAVCLPLLLIINKMTYIQNRGRKRTARLKFKFVK